VYRVVPKSGGPATNSASAEATVEFAEFAAAPPTVAAGEHWLENERFRLEFDPETGFLKSLFDKAAGIEVLAGPAGVPAVIDDRSDTWSHNVFRFLNVTERFAPKSMTVIANGPVKAAVRVVSECRQSRLIQDFTLYAGLDHVDVFCTVDWHEQFRMLKLLFPINVHFQEATSQAPYGHVVREVDGDEEPGGAWVDLSGASRQTDEPYGVSILNDRKYSYNVLLREIGLTVLRSPIYAHHDPMVPDPSRVYSFIDQGIQRFRYAIFPHRGSWQEAGTVHRAAEINEGPVSLAGNMGPEGFLPMSGCFLEVQPGNVVAQVLKQAEDGDGLVIRLYESSGESAHAVVRLPHLGREFEADFVPNEIKTFHLPHDAGRPVREVNILEWALG
jgi:alpha-mannosidase